MPQPPPRGEWRAAAPIQRTVSEHPLVNPTDRFRASLGSWRDPRFLAPLGHAVGAGEPSGLIDVSASPSPDASNAPAASSTVSGGDGPDLPLTAHPAAGPTVVSRSWAALTGILQRAKDPDATRPGGAAAVSVPNGGAGTASAPSGGSGTGPVQRVAEPLRVSRWLGPVASPSASPGEHGTGGPDGGAPAPVGPALGASGTPASDGPAPQPAAETLGSPTAETLGFPARDLLGDGAGDGPGNAAGDGPGDAAGDGPGGQDAGGATTTGRAAALPLGVSAPVQRSAVADPPRSTARPAGDTLGMVAPAGGSIAADAAGSVPAVTGAPGTPTLGAPYPAEPRPVPPSAPSPAAGSTAVQRAAADGPPVPRRLGLGAPILSDGPPAAGPRAVPTEDRPLPIQLVAVAGPAVGPPPADPASGVPPLPHGSDAVSAMPGGNGSGDEPSPAEAPAVTGLTGLTRLDLATGFGGADAIPVQRAVGAAVPDDRAVADSAPPHGEERPLVPLGPPAGPVVRPSALTGETSHAVARLVGDRPSPLTSHRTAEPAAVATGTAAKPPGGTSVTVSRAVGPSSGAGSAPGPPSAVAGSGGFRSVTDPSGAYPPAAQVFSGSASVREADGLPPATAQRAAAFGPTVRSEAPVVVQRRTSPSTGPAAEFATVPAIPVQTVAAPAASARTPAAAVAAPPEPFAATVQRQAEAASATAPTPGPRPGPAVGGEPEELLAKLFDPLLRRLKAELRIDRDRRGSLTDLRR